MGNNFTMPTFGNFAQNMNNLGWNTPTSFAPNFGNFGGFGWGNSLWGAPFGTTKKKTPEELAIEYDDKLKALNEQIEQAKKAKTQMGLVQAPDGSLQLSPDGKLVPAGEHQTEDGSTIEVKSLEELKKDYKNADTAADGTKVTYAKTKKMGFGQKLMRGATSFFKGIGNCIKSIAGFEPDGSWNWKKCLKNVAITAACCFAAPIAATALTAVGATAAIPAVTGAIAVGTRVASVGLSGISMYKLGEGVYKGCTAETSKEFDEGWEQAGSSAFTLFGAKAISKSVNKTTTAYANQSAAARGTTATSVPAQAPQTFGDKVWNWTGGKLVNGIKQTLSPSSWKTTWQGGYASGVKMRDSIKNAQGFWNKTKAVGKTFTQDYRTVNEDQATQAKSNFDRQMQQNKELLDREIAKLDRQIATASPAQKPVLEAARNANANLRNGLDNVKTHQDWANLQTQYRTSMGQLEPPSRWKFWKTPEINGVKVDASTLNHVADSQKLITDSFSGLVNSRVSSIQAMSKVGKGVNNGTYRQEVSDFGYSRWNGGNRIDAWALKHPTTGGKIWSGLSTVGGIAFGTLMDPLYAIANPMSNTAGALWWNYNKALSPMSSATPMAGIDTIWTDDLVAQVDNSIKTIDDQIKALEAEKKAVVAKYESLA